MLRSRNFLLSAVLVSAMCLSPMLNVGSVLAATQPDTDSTVNTESTYTVVGTDTGQGIFSFSLYGGLLMDEAHEQKYLRYLVKDFAPESLPDWEAAFAERQQAKEKLNNMISAQEIPAEQDGSITVCATTGSISDTPLTGLTVVSDGTGTDSDPELIQPSEEELARITTEQAFADAVEKDDAAAIKKLLPQILEYYRSDTDKMNNINISF